jgi:hypothetical protein
MNRAAAAIPAATAIGGALVEIRSYPSRIAAPMK